MNLIASFLDLRDYLGTHILFTLGAMLLTGYLFGRLCGRFKLPEITGFIFAGIVLGQSILGIVPFHMTASMKVITEVALGLIALTIGSEFSLEN
jgi:Kef-type K+ transport system membrane component KefB